MRRFWTRIRIALVIGAIAVLAIPLTIFVESWLRTPSLAIEIVNVGDDPLSDFNVKYPNGAFHADSFRPGARFCVRAESSGPWKYLTIDYATEFKGQKGYTSRTGIGLSEKIFARRETMLWEISRGSQKMSFRPVWWRRIGNQLRERIGF